MNEQSWILTGQRFRGFLFMKRNLPREGLPYSVDFDYEWALRREDEFQDVFGWIHTHPNMIAYPSSRDIQTMESWCVSFGKPLLCAILGSDGLRGWWFKDEEPFFERRLCELPFGIILGKEHG